MDALFNVTGMHVVEVGWRADRLALAVETPPRSMGCPDCGVVAPAHGRRARHLHDIPAFGPRWS